MNTNAAFQGESLAAYVKRVRLEKGLSIVSVARSCDMSKQYLCDVEHGRRGLKMEMKSAAKLAACLDIPISELADRIEHLTDKQHRNYAAYHRVLRSNVRAAQALAAMTALQHSVSLLKIALKQGRDASKVLQDIEIAVKSLDATLAYKGERPKRWADVEGDDAKYTPSRSL